MNFNWLFFFPIAGHGGLIFVLSMCFFPIFVVFLRCTSHIRDVLTGLRLRYTFIVFFAGKLFLGLMDTPESNM